MITMNTVTPLMYYYFTLPSESDAGTQLGQSIHKVLVVIIRAKMVCDQFRNVLYGPIQFVPSDGGRHELDPDIDWETG
jgi:hypothetical protein